ncbi:MAG: 4-alpha-glucanotransferase [Sedimentisphaerales bacterium]
MNKRASGVLLHISSLPSEYGIGDFGPSAYRFADFLVHAGQSYWQVLPLNPPAPVRNNFSPYNSSSAFAGNTLFISPDLLYRYGFLNKSDMRARPIFPQTQVNYRAVAAYKEKLFNLAYERFEHSGLVRRSFSEGGKSWDYERFCDDNKSWLEDYAIFVALHRYFHNQSWINWPAELREHKKAALKAVKTQLSCEINREKFLQFVFFKQWRDLKHYCRKRNIRLIGDISFYVAFESSDVWASPELFKLTKRRKPRFVAGVPPDLFSRTGQLWNNPVYNWEALKKTGYRWWLTRFEHNLNLFDIVRLDHFRGFAAYWQVPARCKTALKGKWVAGPGENFFEKVFERFPVSAFFAEDLGRITPDVRELRDKFNLAGTKVLQSAFGKNYATSTHNPRNFIKNSVVYTGTHDTNTIRGWFDNEADAEQKKNLFDCLARPWARSRRPLGRAEGQRRSDRISAGEIHWALIQLALGSVSNTVIIPMQDILGLGEEARMNRPATIKGNWQWRLSNGRLNSRIANKLRRLTETSRRVLKS